MVGYTGFSDCFWDITVNYSGKCIGYISDLCTLLI